MAYKNVITHLFNNLTVVTCCYWFRQQCWQATFQIKTSKPPALHVHKHIEY